MADFGDTIVKGNLEIYDNTDFVDAVHPVGSIYISTSSVNPGTLLGVGTWSAYAEGRVLLCDTSAGTGGESEHELTINEMPKHDHGAVAPKYTDGGTYDSASTVNSTEYTYTGYTGSGNAHNNLQPYIVAYIWERTE